MESHPRLKILHLLSQRPDSTGSGIYLQAMVREAAARGHDNWIVAGIQSGHEAELGGIDKDRCHFVTFEGGDIPFPIPGMTDIMPYPNTRFVDLTPSELQLYETVFSNVLEHSVSRFRPDIIHSHHLWLVSSLARRRFPDIPVVASCHGTDLRQFQNCPHLRDRVLSGCGRLDAALALSEAQKTDILRSYNLTAERVWVTGAGFNAKLFVPGVKPPPRPVQLVYAGKFIRAKGLPWLLRALARVAMRDWRLHLVGGGSGAERDECLRLAGTLGDRVIVHGQVPQARLAEIFRRSHIFVLSSFFEGLPLVVLEALASGCRVVATGLPGVLEVARGINSEAIDLVRPPRLRQMDQPYAEDLPGFERRLTDALDRQLSAVIQQPQMAMAPIAAMLAACTWQGVFARIETVYHGLTGSRSWPSHAKLPPV
ncbi:MAG: glycosyltransferase family 4 protein [Desulfobacterales bacterium]|nr:glycosyltransferase family 4 protein [Desulfobacterales bacterium]